MGDYQEVIDLVANLSPLNVGLNEARALFGRAKNDLEKLAKFEFRAGIDNLTIDLDKANRNVLKAMEDRKARVLKINKDIADQAARDTLQTERANATAIEAQLSASEKRKLTIRSINANIAREMANQAQRDSVQAVRAVEQQFVQAERAKQAAIRETERQAAQFNRIFQSREGGPVKRNSSSPASPAGFNISAALRAGAGASGAVGEYGLAGTLYASANAMQMLGMSTVSSTAALAGFGTAVSGIILAGGLYTLITWSREFTLELGKMSTLLADVKTPQAEFEQILDRTASAAMRLSAEFNLKNVDVVRAFKEALSSGVRADDLEMFTRQVAVLAHAVGTELPAAANLLTSFKDAYQLSVGEMTEVNDILFNTYNVGKLNINDLINNFGRLLPVGRAAGLSLKDLASGVALLTRQGMTAPNAITSMIQVINGLQTPSDKAKKALTELGIATGDMAFNGRSFLDVITELRDKTGGSGDIIGQLFDEERARRGVASAVQGVELLKNEVIPEIDKVGTAAVAASRKMDNLWENIGKVWQSISNKVAGTSRGMEGALNDMLFGTAEENQKRAAEQRAEVDKYIDYIRLKVAEGETDVKKLQDATTKRFDITRPSGMMAGALAQDEYQKTIKTIQTAISEAMGEVSTAGNKALVGLQDMLRKTSIESMKLLEDITSAAPQLSKTSKLENREIAARQTDEQRQALLDLEAELEIQLDLVEAKKEEQRISLQKQESDFAAENITPIQEDLAKAIAEGNAERIKTLTHEMNIARSKLAEFVRNVREDIRTDNPIDPILGQVNNLVLQIETLRARVMSQDTRKDRDEKERILKLESDAIKKDAEEFARIYQKLYNDDVKNFKEAQDKKAAAIKKLHRDMEKDMRSSMELQSKVASQMLQAQIDRRGGDPDVARRIGEKQRGVEEKNIRDVIGRGGTRDEFDAAVKRYEAAIEIIRNAMSQIDTSRAARNFEEDLSTLLSLNKQFDDMSSKRDSFAESEINRRMKANAVRGQNDLIKAAEKQQEANKQIEQVVLDAKINLQVDGDVSEKTKNSIADAVVKKLQQSQRARNLTSNYDPSTRSDSKVTSE